MPEPELFDAEAMRFVARRDDTAELSQPPLAPDAQASAPLTVLIVGTRFWLCLVHRAQASPVVLLPCVATTRGAHR